MSREDMWPEQKPVSTQPKQDELRVTVDTGIPGGDSSAMTIYYEGKAFVYAGDEFAAIAALINSEALALLERLEDNINYKIPITSVHNIGPLQNGQYIKVKNMKAAIQQEKDAIIGKASTQPTADAQS